MLQTVASEETIRLALEGSHSHVFCSRKKSDTLCDHFPVLFIVTYIAEGEESSGLCQQKKNLIAIIMGNAQSYMRSLASKADSILPPYYENGWYEKSNASSDREHFIRDYALI